MTTAAIIAGGQATRLGGADKSGLIVMGQTILQRQLAVLAPLVDEILIVVDCEERGMRFADLGIPVHVDRVHGAGALGGIYTALECASSDRVLTIACDLPFLDGGLLALLIERSAHADGAWVKTPRGAEPLLACYQRAAGTVMRQAIDAGRLKAADLSLVLRIEEVGLWEVARFGPPDRLLTNVNTPDEYARVAGG